MNNNGVDPSGSVDVLERVLEDTKFEEPKLWDVIFLNDDFTPFEFVIAVLIKEFGMSINKAGNLAINIHTDGRGVAGTYPEDIAELKQNVVIKIARSENFPLNVIIEENG